MAGQGAPKAAAASAEELRAGLAAACLEGRRWSCGEELLQLCGLSRAELAKQVRPWWGKPEPWLDMLATELARELGAKVGLEQRLGAGWARAVDAWVDEAYALATEGMSCPPQRPMMAAKARPYVRGILARAGGQPPPAQAFRHLCTRQAQPNRATCDACGADFSRGLGRCPGCFPPAPPRQAEARERSAEERQAEWRRLPRAPLHEAPWAETAEVLWCHGGSGGTVLLRLPAGVLCAKRCCPEDLFAQRLAGRLGVRTAELRVLGPGCEERADFRAGTQAAAPEVGCDSWLQAKKVLRAPHVAVMEFVDGFGMMGMAAHAYLRGARPGPPPWRELGRLMAFDMLINNFDRLPLAWANEGNLGNVMLGSSLGLAVGIDQSVAPIKHPDGLQRYLARVQQAVAEARGGEGKAFLAVRQAVYNNTAAELAAEELAGLRAGCLELAEQVRSLADEGELEPCLEAVSLEVQRAFPPVADCDALPVATAEGLGACCALVRAVARALQEALA